MNNTQHGTTSSGGLGVLGGCGSVVLACRYDLGSLDAQLLTPENAAGFLGLVPGELAGAGWLRRYDIAGHLRYRASEVVAARFVMTTTPTPLA